LIRLKYVFVAANNLVVGKFYFEAQ